MADYRFKTAHNQEDIILRRRQNAIEVYEKDKVTTIEAGQRLQAQRFLNNLKKSEALLKQHESTKTMLFTRRHGPQTSEVDPASAKKATNVLKSKKSRPSSCPGRKLSDEARKLRCQMDDEGPTSRMFSGRLQEINRSIDVPFVKLSSYTKDDLKRPATALELKRKVWEKMNDYLEKNNDFRLASKGVVARCAGNVPRSVQLARDKLRAFTNFRFLAQLPAAPPRIDVEQAQCQRRELELIEKAVVTQFCDSLDPLKTVLPESFRWMDVSEVYSRNAEVQRVFQQASDNPRKTKRKEDRAMTWMRKDGGLGTITRVGSRRMFQH